MGSVAEPQSITGTADELIAYLQQHGNSTRFSLRVEPVIDEKNEAAIRYLQERLSHALTDPAEIQEAEAELAELHQQLNRNRLEAGERPLIAQ